MQKKRETLLLEATISVSFIGLTWGFSLIFSHQNPLTPIGQSAIGMIAAGLAIVAISGMYRPAGVAMALSIYLPFIVWSILYGHFQHWILVVGMAMYFGMMVVWSKGLLSSLVRSMCLRHENDDLVRELQVAKIKAEIANVEKSRFLAAASHDLRQPMQALILFVGNLRQQWGSREAVKILDHIENSMDAMRALFDALLSISHLDSGGVQPRFRGFAIQDFLSRIESEFSAECDSKPLRFVVWPSDIWVDSDPVLLERILTNLVSNAVKYTPPGGGLLVGCRKRGGRAQLQVWDTGLGISTEHHEAIFSEFFQLNNPERDRNKGLGLGLAIAQRLALVIGAQLELRSVPGRGSVFRVSVPLFDSKSILAEPVSTSENDTARLNGLQLAFVDDEPSICQAIGDMCRPWGVEVVIGNDLEALLQKLGERRPDAVLSDYRLHDGRTGFELIEALRARWPDEAEIPAILLTGDTEADYSGVAHLRSVQVVYKPVSSATLKSLLTALTPT
jgi:signal transduction histidine kinase/CheY-like chemotaxis protein